MPRLPTFTDVQPQQLQRDPGLSVRADALVSDAGIVASELAPAVEEVGDAFRERDEAIAAANKRIQDREEALGRLRSQGSVREKLRQLRETMRSDDDFSDPRVLQEHGKAARAFMDQELQQYSGSEEGKIRLAEILERELSESSDKAAVFSVQAGEARVKAKADEVVNSLSARASLGESPSDLIDEGLSHLGQGMELSLAMRPGQEAEFARNVQAGVYRGTIERFMQAGNLQMVENMLRDPDVQRTLGGETQRGLFQRVNNMRTEAADLTERERYAQRLAARLGDENLADDIAFNKVVLSAPDKFGEQKRINTVTGEELPMTPDEAQAISQVVQEEGDPTGVLQAQPGTAGAGGEETALSGAPAAQEDGAMVPLEEFVQRAVGPGGNTAAFVSNVLGPFVPGALMEDRTEARAAVRFFSQVTKNAFINNPKAPVAEQKLVAKFLPDVDVFFQDPDKARSDVRQLRKGLAQMKEAYQREIDGKRLTSKREAELSDSISRIDVTLEMMGPDIPLVKTQDELDSMKETGKIKPGDEFYWTDGQRYTAE